MGAGDFLSSVFGGGNDYQFTMPPTLGAPRQPGETDADYANRIYQGYQGQNQAYQDSINQAMGMNVPRNVIDYGAADTVSGREDEMIGNLRNRYGQNMDFGTQGAMNQQQALTDQLMAQGRGEGPNPALDQLRMTTDQNARSAAAMAANQRGINPALAARLASQAGANANQTAAGQAALQSAQQQLASQQQAGGLLGQQIAQRTQQTGMNEQNRQNYANLISAMLNQQGNQEITKAGNQAQAGMNLLTGRNNAESLRRQAQLQYQQQLNNIFSGMNATNAGVASQNAATNFQYGQGAMSGLSSLLTGPSASSAGGGSGGGGGMGNIAGMAAMMNRGGEVDPFKAVIMRKMADGGVANFLNYQQDPMAAMYGQLGQSANIINQAGQKSKQSIGGMSAGLSQKISGLFNQPIASNSMEVPQTMGTDMMMSSKGGKVDGKAEVKGDSEKNDTVPALLSPGEIVIPRSVTGNPDAAHAFLDKVINQHQGPDYRDIMKAKEHYHKLAHGGEMYACPYCNGGMAYAEGGEVKDKSVTKPPEPEKKPWYERIMEPSADKTDALTNAEAYSWRTNKRGG